jgi:transcriptional regulator with XRE-family HTH domain
MDKSTPLVHTLGADMQISADQSKAGRALLGWTQGDLATHAKVNKRTVMDFESGCREPHPGTLALLVQAFDVAGVEFIPANTASPAGGEGVRKKAIQP